MRTVHTLLFATLVAVSVFNAGAQDRLMLGVPPLDTWSRTDRVLCDMTTPAGAKERTVFARTAWLGEEGLFHARIHSPEGVLRMQGTFLDSSLTVPHGQFAFYHTNGRIESSGAFHHGIKTGDWACWTITGEPRAVRKYHGLPWEELQFVVGAAEKARTVGERSDVIAVF